MSNMTKEKCKRHPEVESKLLPDGHIVLFTQKTNWAHTLTPMGALVWEFCDGKNSLDDIVKLVAQVTETQQSGDLRDQVTTLLEELAEAGLFVDDEEDE